MKPLRRPDQTERSSLFVRFFGLDFDPAKDYSPGELFQLGLRAAQGFVQGLLHPGVSNSDGLMEDDISSTENEK